MVKAKRRSVLLKSEVESLYCQPQFTSKQQRFFFNLNDREKEVINRLHDRMYRGVAVVWFCRKKTVDAVISAEY